MRRKKKMQSSFSLAFIRLLVYLVACASSDFALAASAPDKNQQIIDSFSLIEVSGTINPGSADFIRSSIKSLETSPNRALIIQLNTPGGLLSSTRDILQDISMAKNPVIVYVYPGGSSATSAGAIISIASHLSAMSPGSNIGAAHPVASGGKNVEGDMGKKVTNDTAALVRSQAKLRGRNIKVSEKIVTESVSLSAEEALKKNLINFVATDHAALLKKLDRQKVKVGEMEMLFSTASLNVANIETIKMSPGQQMLHLLANPNISTMLMALGGIAIYSEISSGFALIFPGLFGLFCILIAFISLQMLPINVGGLLLFGLGMLLIIAEAYITSFGLLAIGGIVSITLGALFLIDQSSGSTIAVSMSMLIPILSGIGMVMGTIAYLLAREGKPSKEFDPFAGVLGEVREVNGRQGKVFILGEIWNFKSDEDLKLGDSVQVYGKKKLTLKVKRKM